MGGLVALFRRRRAESVAAPPVVPGAVPRAVPVVEVVEVDEAALIAASGVDVSAPLPLCHVLLVHDPAAAERLAAAVGEAGYEARIDTHDGGWTWIVSGSETALLTPAYAAAARAALSVLAARHAAEYEGWQVTSS